MFCNHLRAVCPTPLEYLNFVTDMLQPLLEERQTMRKALMGEGIVKYWSDIVKTHADKGVNKEVRQAAMHLMVELWSQLPEGIEGIPELPNLLLGLLKKGTKKKNVFVDLSVYRQTNCNTNLHYTELFLIIVVISFYFFYSCPFLNVFVFFLISYFKTNLNKAYTNFHIPLLLISITSYIF